MRGPALGVVVALLAAIPARSQADEMPAPQAFSASGPTDVVPAPRSPASAEIPAPSHEYFREESAGFVIHYHPAARERVRDLLETLPAMRDELSRVLGVSVLGSVELRIAELPIELATLAPPFESRQPSYGGLSFPNEDLVVVSLGGAELAGASLEASLRHHLAHLALREGAIDGDGAYRVPAWFEEGFAIHFARAGRTSRAFDMSRAAWSSVFSSGSGAVIHAPIGAADPHRTSDTVSADFARFTEKQGALPPLFEGLREGLDFERAVETAFGRDPAAIEAEWRRDVTWRYAVVPACLFVFALVCMTALAARWRKRRKNARLSPAASSRAFHRPSRARFSSRRRETKLRIPIHLADQREVPVVEHDGRWHTLH